MESYYILVFDVTILGRNGIPESDVKMYKSIKVAKITDMSKEFIWIGYVNTLNKIPRL